MVAALRLRPIPHPVCWALALGPMLVPAEAAAATSSYHLQVVRAEGAGSCPSVAVFEREVSERLGRDPFSEHGERGIEVVLSRHENEWLALVYLRIDPRDSADAVRSLTGAGPDCSELRKSVVLALVLAIAPDLPPPPEPEPEPEPQQCPPPPPPEPPPPPPASLHGELSLRGLLSPKLLPADSLGLGLVSSFRGELFGAAFGGVFFPDNELRSGDARLGFGLSAFSASGCLWARTKEPQLWSCIGARFGALHSVVHTPKPLRPGDHFWWAASSELGLRQHLFGRAFVEAGVAAVFPLVRYRFQVDANASPVYEQGPAVAEGFVGLGLRLD